MTAARHERLRTVVYSLVLLATFLVRLADRRGRRRQGREGARAFPGRWRSLETAWHMLADPFYDRGPNDKGFGLQLGYSLGRA